MRPYKSEGTLNTIESSTTVHINLVTCIVKGMLKNRINDNDKLECFTKRLTSQKY